MKIRTDFVTNSSSVSYLLTMSKKIVDIYQENFRNTIDVKTQRIVSLLHDDLVKNGTRVMYEGEQIYTKKITFATDGDCMWDDTFDKPIEEIDFSKLTDDKLWAYIFGEYILNGKISQLGVKGFGATQVETY